MFWKRFVPSCVAIVVVFWLAGCGGSKSPSVTVTASAVTVDPFDSVTLTAVVANDKSTNGTADGVTWSVTSGGSSSLLSNTTTTSATFTAPAATSSPQKVVVTAISVADATKTGSVTLTVPAALSITTTSEQLTGAVGTAYSVQLTTSTGISPYIWSVDPSTPLPTNWNLSPSGLLTAPAPMNGETGGTYTFDVHDSGTPTPMTTSQSLTVSITPAPAITFSGVMPATATYNTSYSGSAAATGGAGALSYSATSLPPGLSINSTTGAVTGLPTAVGTFNPSVTAADAFGDAKTQGYTITVSAAAQSITFANPGAQTVGTPLTLSATASSGLAVSFASTT
ncbi:MAG: putative Ig domain-containing protein, partial [Terracidiphilus sp.]